VLTINAMDVGEESPAHLPAASFKSAFGDAYLEIRFEGNRLLYLVNEEAPVPDYMRMYREVCSG
jgi:hypothetical protein